MQGELATTNLLLGIMAAVSLLEMLVLIGAAVMGYRMYQKAMATIEDLDRRRIAPLVQSINEVINDVRGITARVNEQTERVDHAIRGTIDRVDETADRVRSKVRDKAGRIVGIVLAVRGVIERLLTNEPHRRPPAAAAGRA